jgi:hypothetical protein
MTDPTALTAEQRQALLRKPGPNWEGGPAACGPPTSMDVGWGLVQLGLVRGPLSPGGMALTALGISVRATLEAK